MWTCHHCKEENEDTFDSCWSCQHDRDSQPGDAPTTATSVTASMNARTLSLSERYKDAYTEAHAVVGVGGIIKVVAIVLFIVAILIGLGMSSDRGGGGVALMFGFALACILGVPTYILGILISSQGQTLLATLDTAVNSSRHLTDDQVADIMLKRFSL
jgi:hypothetical protein